MNVTIYIHKANGEIETKIEKQEKGIFNKIAEIEGSVIITTKTFKNKQNRDFSKFDL